ncbi:MAG: Bug family tripartite tricarboxylate transporter substrate binding protein [Xanthobacteraceae bacterium]
MTRTKTSVAAALGLLILACAANAQTPAEFFRGKRMTLITSASVGGGYDQYARLLAKHMPKHIPGNPTIVVQNMVGAEGIRAANYLYKVAAQDGSVIGGLSRNNGLARFYDPNHKTVQFDARKFHWLGSPQQEIGLFILRTNKGVKTIDDLKRIPVVVSSTTRGAPTSIYPRMLNALYGAKIKVIDGYGGSQKSLLAVERKEVDGHVSGGSSAAFRARIAPWIKRGEAAVILQMGMVRDAEYPNIPTALEIMPTAEGKQLFEIAFAEQVMGRPFVLPPGVPADRVKALRAAFDAAVKDPELLKDAKSQRMEIDPVTGAAINALLDRVYAAPPALAAKLREIAK